ncbi:unnamed protein product [Durusdinium trenchii]|uniref:Protein kinase domain-containing protein n=1 Tax=Durusdinium trenchii TaxID=1381693 RepID=A0ABP0JLH8_9DINO
MGQQGSRPDANAVTELPSAHGGRQSRLDVELKEVTEVDLTSSSSQSKVKRDSRPPSSQGRLPPTKPAAPSNARPPSSQGPGRRGPNQGQGPLLLNKSGQLRRTATERTLDSNGPLDESPPPTRPGTAASLVSVNAAVRNPQRYRVELPGQMPDIRGDPSPPPSQPASLALRSRPGTSQNSQLLAAQFTQTKAFARPASSGNDPALQHLPLAVTLKGPTGPRRNMPPGRPETLEMPKAFSRPMTSGTEAAGGGRRGIRWVEDIARHYRIGTNVMPSCHAGMEIRHASRASEDTPTAQESFVVKLRYKNKSFQGKNEESRWRNNTELILNMPQSNGIARLIDVLEDSKAYYVVMERAGGCDLYECLSGAPERRLPAHEAREVLRELLAAVAELHSHGFIHKDQSVPRTFGETWPPALAQVSSL